MITTINMAPNSLKFKASRPFIGVFDSGAGGISVLGALMCELPEEEFLYFGDSAFTPYGEKPYEWIVDRSREICSALVDAGAKAVVIACNTATAAAAQTLRNEFPHIPIIGVEPALKPATETPGIERILVMATPITIHQDKYQKLAETYTGNHQVASVECPGLAARIEQGSLDAPDLEERVEELVGEYRNKVDAVVLGCTHYAFIAPTIKHVVGDVPLFDGAQGTARQLHRRLEEEDLLVPCASNAASSSNATSSANKAHVQFVTSGLEEESFTLYEDFLQDALNASFMR